MHRQITSTSRTKNYFFSSSSSESEEDTSKLSNHSDSSGSASVCSASSASKAMERSNSESSNCESSASESKEEEGGEKQTSFETSNESDSNSFAVPLTREELKTKTVPVLKEMLKESNLRTGGKKDELIDRLLGLEVNDDTDLSRLPVLNLREMLKARNLPSGGKKKELINRLEGTESVDTGTYDDFNRYTNNELVEKLKHQNRDTGGTKEDMINRLLGREPPMPKEGWANSEDREKLIKALRRTGSSSLRMKTAEEAYALVPYNRWPWYRFKGYFKDALVGVLKDEVIANQDNRDLQALLDNNPRPELTSRGKRSIILFTFIFLL